MQRLVSGRLTIEQIAPSAVYAGTAAFCLECFMFEGWGLG